MRNLHVRFLDLLAAPFAALAGMFLRLIRTAGLGVLPMCSHALFADCLLPVRRHYYEPFPEGHGAARVCALPSMRCNLEDQGELIESFNCSLKMPADCTI